MANRGYSSEENEALAALVKRFNGGKESGILRTDWAKVRCAFLKKFPAPKRTAAALTVQYYRHIHLPVLRGEILRLEKEARESRTRADVAEAKLRRLVAIMQGRRRRAESALVEHAKD